MQKHYEMEGTEPAVSSWITSYFLKLFRVKPGRKRLNLYGGTFKNCAAKDMLPIIAWWNKLKIL